MNETLFGLYDAFTDLEIFCSIYDLLYPLKRLSNMKASSFL